MNKEALLNNILNELEEIQSMVKSFQGQQNIPAAFLELTEKKLTHVAVEFKLLIKEERNPSFAEPVAEVNVPVQHTDVIEERVGIPVSEIDDKEVIDEKPVVETTKATETKVTIKPKEEEKEEEPLPVSEAKREVTVEPPVKKECEESKKTIGESFVGEKKSVNDIIANTQDTNVKKVIKGKPVNDLTKGLGINDRFMFQRELFEGKADMMTQTLLQLNDMPDFNAAQSFIKSNFDWDEEQEVTKAFFNYIERKF